jgi:hypothetical protein
MDSSQTDGTLSARQFLILVIVSLALWALATAYIRWLPDSISDPVMGAIGFVTSVPVGWLSVWIIRRCASLGRDQLLAGVSMVGAIAMMIDGLVLHWAPQVYGETQTILRLGAAWLLWGYGVSFAIALLMSRAKKAVKPESLSTVAR